MANREALTLIVNCLLIHFTYALDLPSYIINTQFPVGRVIGLNVGIGVSLLLFPMFGLLADVWLTRYLVIQASLVILAIDLIITLIGSGFAVTFFQLSFDIFVFEDIIPIFVAILIAIMTASIGLFEANAIQFGMDQILEASSSQLSAFIHQYFWAMHLGQELVFCVALVSVICIPATPYIYNSEYESYMVVNTAFVVMCLVWMSCVVTSSFLLHHAKKHMYIAKTAINPFKKMFKVLYFAWKNKYPLSRSAFTYCEDYTPSRLDLGKEQYGGPFTMEEVEDVKTFLRLLLLLVSLFGYHVAGDGFAVAQHMEQYSCPSLIVWGLIAFNPSSVSSMVVLIFIPLGMYLPKIHKLIPNMLKRMGMGLMILVMQDLVYTVLVALPVVEKTMYADIYGDINATEDRYLFCFQLRANFSFSGKLFYGSDPVDYTFLWLICPQILNGLAQLLVHMTALEFICAQAPRSLQGLLIGLWYAMFSIRYLLMSSLDHVFTSSLEMLIYQAVRSGLVLVSLVMYICVSRTCQYRVRDWVINVQWIVEDIFERRMDQEENYIREQMAVDQSLYIRSSSKNDYGSFNQI